MLGGLGSEGIMIRAAAWAMLLISACASAPQPVAPSIGERRGTARADQLPMRDPDGISKAAGPTVEPLRPVPVRLDEVTAKQAEAAK
jgi:hypothetical protein